MSVVSNLQLAIQRIASEIKGIKAQINSISGTADSGMVLVTRFQLQTYAANATDAVKNAVIANNNAAIIAAIKSRPGALVVLDPSQAWPAQLDFDGFDSAFVPQYPIRLRGALLLPRPTAGVASKSALQITRSFGAAQAVTNIGPVVLGLVNPAWNTPSYTVSSFRLASGNYAAHRAGKVFQLVSADSYAWAQRAGYDNVWKGAFVTLAGILMPVTGYSFAAASTASVAAGKPAIDFDPTAGRNGFEAREVKGASSNVTALVQGDTANGQLIFSSIPGNFTQGENLIDVRTGALIGQVGQISLITVDRLNTSYTTTPFIREVPLDLGVELDLRIEIDSNQDDFMLSSLRPSAVQLDGVASFNVTLDVRGGYARALVLFSCFRGKVDVTAKGLPNHALEYGPEWQNAYGYAVGVSGCTEMVTIYVNAIDLRHGITTNGWGGTYNRNSRNNTVDATGVLCDNYHVYGTVRRCRFSATTKGTFAAGIDTHEGCEDNVIENFDISMPTGLGRNLTNGAGVVLRGFGNVVRNGIIRNAQTGIADGSAALDSGGLAHTNHIYGVVIDGFQNNGISVDGPTISTLIDQSRSNYRLLVENVLIRGDGTAKNSPYYQYGIVVGNINLITRNVKIEKVNGLPVRHNRGGIAVHENLVIDYTDAKSTSPLRVDTAMDQLSIFGLTYIMGALSIGDGFIDHGATGTTPINYRGFRSVPGLATGSAAGPTKVLKTGNPTGPVVTLVTDPGEINAASSGPSLPAGGSTGQILRKSSSTDGDAAWAWAASATKVNVDGVFQPTLDISSDPVVKIVSFTADTPAPAAGANVADTALQTSLPAGDWLVEADILYSVTTGTAGALRLGLGGAGAASSTLVGPVVSRQATSTTGTPSGAVYITGLATAGTVATVGTNVAGVSPGSFALPIEWTLSARVQLSAAGVLGLMAQMSNGADRVGTIRAGSWIKFTKVA